MITGKVNGGGGSDWLDYSAYTHPVVVNLAKGTATAVAGRIAGIQNVRGSAFGSNLVGDWRANVLVGGAGIDVIQGGSKSQHPDRRFGQRYRITAGAGSAILIGGTTSYDSSGLDQRPGA